MTKRTVGYILAGLAAGAIGLGLRLYPLTHYVSPEAYEKGALLALGNIRRSVASSVEHKYPNLAPAEKKRLTILQFDQLIRDENEKVRKAIYEASRRIETTLPSNGKPPYLQASDSHYYYGLTQNIQKTGAIGEAVKGSKYFNPLMLAPEGHWEPLTLHPYVGYGLHRLITLFKPDSPLMLSVAFTPLVITALCLIPFVFICAISGCSPLAAGVGAVHLLMSVAFFERSLFGWYDNDPYNILFPLTILAFFFCGIQNKGRIKILMSCALACSFFMALYALFWQGWVFLESVLVLSGLAVLLFNHFTLKDKADTRRLAAYLAVALGGAFAGVGIVFGFGEFFVLFREGWTALNNFLQSELSPWPDLYIAVGELLKTPLRNIIVNTGGFIAFGVALWGVAGAFGRFFRHNVRDHLFPVLVNVMFLAIAVVLALGAKRFTLQCLVPLSLLFPLGLQHLFDESTRLTKKYIQIPEDGPSLVPHVPAAALALVLVILPIHDISQNLPRLLRPIFNDTWENALFKIRSETPSQSVVNTWWPPGHFITTYARRRVTFDGATINVPQAYWLANVFLSSDERRALGILRMLNNSANAATEYLEGLGFRLSAAVDLLKAVTPLNENKARETLSKVLTPPQAAHLLKLTHTPPPPSYLMIYNDLIEKNIQISFVGKWDFRKIEVINSDPQRRRQVPRPKTKEYMDFLWGIAGGHPRFSGELMPVATPPGKIVFEDNVTIDLGAMTCQVHSDKYGKGVPRSLLYLNDGALVEKKLPGADFSYSVILGKRNREHFCVLADSDLARSLMMKLYYFGGKGLKYFKPFLHESNLTRRTEILVYEVDWPGFLEDLEGGP